MLQVNDRFGLNMEYEIVTDSAAETIEFGRKIGLQLTGGEVFAICGTLGSGKTHLIKGIAAGAGAEHSEQVNSPTFVIVNEYEGREGLYIYHIDAYRLNCVAEFEMLGFDDFCHGGAVVLIEWADKVKAALEGTGCVWVEMSHVGQSKRGIRICNGPEYMKFGD